MKLNLAIIFILLVSTALFAQTSMQKANELLEQEKAAPGPGIDTGIEKAIRQPQDEIAYTATKSRDPFKELIPEKVEPIKVTAATSREAPLPKLTVEGVVWGTAIPQAIINGKVLNIGDTIEGAKIVEINQEGVSLLFNEKIYIVRPASITPKPNLALPDS